MFMYLFCFGILKNFMIIIIFLVCGGYFVIIVVRLENIVLIFW